MRKEEPEKIDLYVRQIGKSSFVFGSPPINSNEPTAVYEKVHYLCVRFLPPSNGTISAIFLAKKTIMRPAVSKMDVLTKMDFQEAPHSALNVTLVYQI